jgi:hypothetical protein
MYEVKPEVIGVWIEKILHRCQSVARRVVVTELPLASIERLGRRRYEFVRRIVFPRCRLSLDEAKRRALAINQTVHRAAKETGAAVVGHDAAWYGFDPIHIRRASFAAAWSDVLQSWSEHPERPARARGSLARWWRLRTFSPEKRDFFGVERTRPQPAGRLGDGTTVWLY